MTSDPTPSAAAPGPRHGAGLPWSARTWRATANAGLDLGYGLLVGLILLVGLSLGLSLLVVIIGFPILFATLWFGRVGSSAFRFKQSAVLAEPAPGRPWPRRAPGQSVWTQFWRVLSNVGLWLESLHGLLMLGLGLLWFVLVVTAWSGALAALAFPVYASWIPQDAWPATDGLTGAAGRIAIALVGIALLFAASWVAEGTARADSALTRWLLSPSRGEQLRTQVDTLRATRDAAVRTADDERRRIERDLHDGVQPQLVALAMNLGMAQRRIDTDPDRAKELIGEAHEEAKRAIVELRNVIRDVHPAVLNERGLDPALSALAARSPLPVRVQVAPDVADQRFPATIEAVAYFAVAEALTNVARHARADGASVDVWQGPPSEPPIGTAPPTVSLFVKVSDNGMGGALAAPGSGLGGLRDRIAAVDGKMWVESPPGAGTAITVELPCGS